MTIEQIRAFLIVANSNSISKAAEELFVSTSSLSYQLKTFESELGICLFNHRANKIELTETGRFLAYKFEKGMRELDKTLIEARQKESGLIRFRLAFGNEYSYAIIGEAADRYRAANSSLELSLLPRNLQNPLEPLINQNADALIIIDEYAGKIKGSSFIPVQAQDIYVVRKRTSGRNSIRDIHLKEILNQPVLFPQDIEKYAGQLKIYRSIKSVYPEFRAVHNTAATMQEQFCNVANGAGIVFCHKFNAVAANSNPELEALRVYELSHTIGLCWVNKEKESEIRRFADIWLEVIKEKGV